MIGYVVLGTNDLARGAVFYDAIAAEMGVGRMGGQPATVGNGVMAALEAKDRAQVDRIHALALSLGGTCEGPPGERFEGFYAAYFRDLDGNKLNAYVYA